MTYGWLGGKERAQDTTGLTLMGARLYNPTTGLFTSVDPVPGGNTTAYAYPQDPINHQDLDGRFALRKWIKRGVAVLGVAAAVGCIVATAGVCGALALGAAAASIGSNFYSWKRGKGSDRMTGRQFAANTAFDLFSAFVPGARAVRRFPGAHTKLGNVVRARLGHPRHMNFSGRRAPAVRLREAARYRPVRTTARIAFNVYSARRSATGRWW
ncbi:RHS repeat-associated core domain-containing protein [Cellulosimicrobium sp. NPDC057127]|uniref:RHS repeat-associated core domain-containing protein n=1 Tax=Cellulosimicrobium sp. NPDC057127 TaxID=3346026 RepID=UPI0036343459